MIYKNIIRFIVLLFIGFIISISLGEYTIPNTIPTQLFDVLGILFPVALALVTTVNLVKVTNDKYRKAFRENIRNVRTSLITVFTLSVVIYFLASIFSNNHYILYNTIYIQPNIFATVVLVFSIAHIIQNFISIQKFKEELEDKISEEEQQDK